MDRPDIEVAGVDHRGEQCLDQLAAQRISRFGPVHGEHPSHRHGSITFTVAMRIAHHAETYVSAQTFEWTAPERRSGTRPTTRCQPEIDEMVARSFFAETYVRRSGGLPGEVGELFTRSSNG